MTHLFVLDLSYTDGLEKVEQHMQEHRDFLAQHYATGLFLASGRKEPRTGGVILAQGTRSEIEAVVAQDPFMVNSAVRYSITEFIPTMKADCLSRYTEQHP